MTPQFAVGDRVVIQGYHPELDGREGTVTEAEFSAVRAYPYLVRIDNDPNWNGMDGRLFTADELIAVSKPVPEPGTLIRVKQGKAGEGLSNDYVGKELLVVPRPTQQSVARSKYAIFVADPDSNVTEDYPLPLYDDEYEIVEPTPTPQFAPGDRVVYAIPEMYYGRPGKDSAARPAGSKGTVTEVYDSGAVNVNWDDYGLANVDTAFLARAPKPTHRYPEGLYRAGRNGERVFITHDQSEGGYQIAYLDGRTARGDVPVNEDMTEVIVSSYTLIATA